jgi:hypothetical protein
VADQLQSISSCGLLDVANISVGFYGLPPSLKTMRTMLQPLSPAVSIGLVNSNSSSWSELGETGTLEMIRDYCRGDEGGGGDDSGDKYAVYFHSKGVSRKAYLSQTIHWRKYMEYFVLQKPQDCLAALNDGYSTCGVDWAGMA